MQSHEVFHFVHFLTAMHSCRIPHIKFVLIFVGPLHMLYVALYHSSNSPPPYYIWLKLGFELPQRAHNGKMYAMVYHHTRIVRIDWNILTFTFEWEKNAEIRILFTLFCMSGSEPANKISRQLWLWPFWAAKCKAENPPAFLVFKYSLAWHSSSVDLVVLFLFLWDLWLDFCGCANVHRNFTQRL